MLFWILGILVLVGLTVWFLPTLQAYFGFSYTVPPQPTGGLATPIEDRGLLVSEVVVGTGPEIATEDSHLGFQVLYTGSYADGVVFDNDHAEIPYLYISHEHGEEGHDDRIGWEKALVGMRVGGTRIVTILPEYHERAEYADQFPPNATLIYQIKLLGLLDVDAHDEVQPPPNLPQVDPNI
jgi:hypothetical protein